MTQHPGKLEIIVHSLDYASNACTSRQDTIVNHCAFDVQVHYIVPVGSEKSKILPEM
jgi:hypothetical protein